MPAPKEVLGLVERFDRNREAYRSLQYNEMQLRREFLDPFFAALGWAVDNRAGWAEVYKEVIHEDAIKIGGFTKAPDYCFRIGGNRKFFVEAKKPAVDIRQDTSPAFQLRRYASAGKGNYDIYVVFVEKGLSLLNEKGRLGYILPHKFFNAQYGEPLRGLIAKGKHLAEVVHFGDRQVFGGATTYTCLMFLDKAGAGACKFEKVENLDAWRAAGQKVLPVPFPPQPASAVGEIPANTVGPDEWNFTVGQCAPLFEKMRQVPKRLGDIGHLFVGLQTVADDVYILEEIRRDNGRVLCASKATGSQHWLEDEHLKPLLKGSINIRRYALSGLTKRLIFPYEMKSGRSVLIGEKEYGLRYPLTWEYLEVNKKRLSSRNKGKIGVEWYGYVYKKNHTMFGVRKLLVPSIASGSCFAIDLEGKYHFVGSGGGGGGGYGITLRDGSKLLYLFVLGLLNSSLLNMYLRNVSTTFRGGYLALNRQYIEQLPIRTIDFSNPADKGWQDRMVTLVELMLSLHKQLAAANTGHEKTALHRQIDATDRQIDQLVYELYGLTEDEISIVEGATGPRKRKNGNCVRRPSPARRTCGSMLAAKTHCIITT
jgi:hypothetical protein